MRSFCSPLGEDAGDDRAQGPVIAERYSVNIGGFEQLIRQKLYLPAQTLGLPPALRHDWRRIRHIVGQLCGGGGGGCSTSHDSKEGAAGAGLPIDGEAA